jgi:hypothetical protein
MEAHFKGPLRDRPEIGGDALWSFRGNNKLEKGVINIQGGSGSATSPMS